MNASREDFSVSFEYFPPKSDEMERQLWQAVEALSVWEPNFVTMTYGAGGSTKEPTLAAVSRMVGEMHLPTAAHLTCVDASREETRAVIEDLRAAGVRRIVALRGDPATGIGTAYAPHPDGYRSTPELIAGIRKIAPFEVSVSFYPERHPDSPSHGHDIDLLKAKMDAGASRALGQFCFDNDLTARFRDDAAKAGIAIPVVPGIMPTTNFTGVARMAAKTGASIPAWLAKAYEGLEDDVETRRIVAAAVLADQVQQLRTRGFGQFHFYTLNQANLTYAACRILGLRPKDLS